MPDVVPTAVDAPSADGLPTADAGVMPEVAAALDGAPAGDATVSIAGDAGAAGVDTAATGSDAAAATGPCAPDPALVLCLQFEGRLLDESPARLRVEGAPAGYAPGPTGLAAEMTAGQRLTVPANPALVAGRISLRASVRPRALGRSMTILESPGHYGLAILGSGAVMCVAGPNGYALRPTAVEPDVWTDLHCRFDGQGIALYVNGRLVREAPSGPLAAGGGRGLHIGWDDDPPRPFAGLIDDVRVWRDARAPEPRP